MFRSLKEYIKLKSGLQQNREELKLVAERLDRRYEFLSAYMNLTWPERLQVDPLVLRDALQRIKEEYGTEQFSTAVHKNDLMFAFHVNQHRKDLAEAVFSYFRVGISTAENLEKITSEAGLKPHNILDFGSGYGRVSRFLPTVFPDAEITASEVKEQAVSFQKSEFGFEGILHNQQVESFPGKQYDLIVALSVFTHLPRHSFEAWLKKLLSMLSENGALVFTYHDVNSEDAAEVMERLRAKESEFVYTERSEDRYFSFVADSIKNHSDYGSTFVRRSYLRNLIPENHDLSFLDRGLVKAQDAAMIRKTKSSD